MECKCKRIRQVKGNSFTLAILLQEQQRVIGTSGDYTTTKNYVPEEGDVVTIVLKSECGNTVTLETTVAGNCVTAEVGGDVAVGCYGVEIVVTKADGKQRRFYESTLVEIVNETRDAGIDDGVEFGVDSYLLQALMIAGLKGEKGEVEFDKLTPEQLALLKGEKGDKGDRGEPGAIGPTGTGISGIAYYADDASGNRIYTISLTDSSSYNITVPKGTGISSITYSGQDAEGGNVYIMQLTDNTSATFTAPKGATGNDGADGVNGQDGADGEDGVGIEDIEFKEEDADGGNVYTITLSNSDTYDITAPKGTSVANVAYKSTDASGGYVYTITLTNGDTFDFTAPKGDAGIYVGDDDGTAPVVSFDPQSDTVHVTAQTLSAAQQLQARTNIGAGTSSFSGSYNDLTNKPTIPAAQVNADWNAASGMAQILNKPTIPDTVSGVNDGTNWTSITIGSTTKAIPSGGSGEANVIESISINGTTQTVTSKNVDLPVPTSTAVTQIVSISQNAYDALATKDSATLYLITS